ncbi:hypothetical protein ScPMuIL_011324 [Solemya velum]
MADDANNTTALDTKSSPQEAPTCSKENDPCENVEKGKGNNQGPVFNLEELRRSVRCPKVKRSFSPEPADKYVSTPGKLSMGSKRMGKGRSNKLSPHAATGPDRLCDRLPNGQPFSCDLCSSPFVCNPLTKRTSKFKRSRHMPSPRQKTDPRTGKVLVLCNACGLAFDQPRQKKEKVVPSLEKKEEYIKSARLFASTLSGRLKEPEAERLYCPSFKSKPCSCLQTYIIDLNDDEGSTQRALELVNLVKEARRLSSLKCYNLQDTEEASKKQKKE